ncbi:GH92 family glycosyl hydrolase [Vagococcus salmoninarum]|uniref:GH92 family glycosyl hydrolase n=1 Tax=Vagococcus salmoninarum TaxID=2739 RepID=UPI0028D8C797|nr:GH92 family glycosyl hydrolase [Vagococcus salmoninarum]
MLHLENLLKIDTRQGTNNQHSYSNGNCLPYTTTPFGMNHYVVQTTDQKGSWFFNPHDRTFQGIRLTHQPSPWMGDFSHLLFSPIAGDLYGSSLFHQQSSYRTEEAVFAPHYLKVKQERYQITSEFTPTTYGGCLLNHYDGRGQVGFVLRSEGPCQWEVDPQARTLKGYLSNFSGCEDPEFKMYVSFTFDQAIDSRTSGFYQEGEFVKGLKFNGTDGAIVVRFQETKVMTTHFASSFLSAEQADLNLAQIKEASFQELQQAAGETWLEYLNRIEVSSRNEEQVKTFYGCLYRTCLFPQKFYEINQAGQAEHYDTLSRTIKPGVLYTNNGFWDTYKTVYPLYSLIAPTEYAEMLTGFLNSYRNAGFLPKWLSPDERGLMPGTLIDAVIADAAVKGIASELMPELLEAMLVAATTQSPNGNYGRRGTLDYLKYGYVPLSHHESVNHTLDYAYSDYCIARVAETLNEKELKSQYDKQSRNFLNLFDPQTGAMRAKDIEGNFRESFELDRWGLDYAEGSSWQNGFATYHDFAALIKAYGGTEQFNQKLTELCNTAPTYGVTGYGYEIHEMSEMAAVDFGQVALSNQPSFHLPYLFNYIGKPSTTQVVVKQLMTELFNSSWDGYPGDEDNGSMSAWYIFSTLGFYPVCPGSGEYVTGIPLFDEAVIHLGNGQQLTIKTQGNHRHANFVTNIQRNSEDYQPLFFTHDDLMTGGKLDFQLGLAPTEREYTNQQKPASLSSY